VPLPVAMRALPVVEGRPIGWTESPVAERYARVGVEDRLRYPVDPRARSSADRASGFGPEGRGFESLRARQPVQA
jgi:hypothetical protein